MNKNKNKKWYFVLTDKQVEDACKLRGVDPNDGNRIIFEVIPQAFNASLRRYYRLRSALGGEYGRWEVVPLSPNCKVGFRLSQFVQSVVT
jgi:hypothetical protein